MPDGVPDDEIERRLHELNEEVNRAERLKQVTARKAAEKATKIAAKESRRAEPGRRARLTVAWVAAVAILATGGVVTWQRLSQHAPSAVPDDTKPVRNGPIPTATGTPPKDPFAGSPADAYADGAAGIVIPADKPVTGFTTAQVKAAYQKTKELLIAANLDWPTLRGGAPDAYASLLIPQQRHEFVSQLDDTGVDKHGYGRSSRGLIASFAPGTTAFVTQTVKVHGTMSAATATISGRHALDINVNYIFTYAVEPPGHPANWTRIVDHYFGSMQFATWYDASGALEAWVDAQMNKAGGMCSVGDGYIHPQFPGGSPEKVQPSGPAVDPYGLATPAAGSSACVPATRT